MFSNHARKNKLSLSTFAMTLVVAGLLPLSSHADDMKKPNAKATTQAEITKNASTSAHNFEDVEMLLDKKTELNGQMVSVEGEVKRKIDRQSFVLESGGILNDEVVVIIPNELKNQKMNQIKEDTELKVTGTLRTVPVVEIRRELSWDLDQQIETELQEARAFLIVDSIAKM